MKHYLVLATLAIGFQAICLPAANALGSPSLDSEYMKLKKSGKGLVVAGSVSASAGAILMFVGFSKSVEESSVAIGNSIGTIFGVEPEPVDENKGSGAMISGLALFLGGTAMIIVGKSKLKKAKILEGEAKKGIGLQPYAPPIRVASQTRAQQGITFTVPIGR
jgi:hypothetical protein